MVENDQGAAAASAAVYLAFNELATVVGSLIAEGRATRAAGVKARLLKRTDPPFDEKALGFATFRDFLRAAGAAGFVTPIEPAAIGEDMNVLLPRPTSANRVISVPAPGPRIREDLWDAFSRWDWDVLHLWDTQAQRAMRIPARARPNESTEQAALRAAWNATPSRFVTIDFVTPETLVSWAKEWVTSLDVGTISESLLHALDDDLPVRKFTDLVRQHGLVGSWQAEYTRRMRGVIGTWRSAHGLQIDLTPASEPPRVERRRSSPTRVEVLELDVDKIRNHVHSVVDQMTVGELLSLSVPLRLTLNSQ
jgi:hypothetical protein